MARKWKGLFKIAEEASELIQELMKLNSYPDGKHPRRRTNLINTTEAEIADLYATLDYFVAKNSLDVDRIKRRRAYKYRKWVKRWGDVPKKPVKNKGKKRASKKRAAGQSSVVDVSLNAQ